MPNHPTVSPEHDARITVLGLGAMGSALAERQLSVGRPVTVWNRTPGRDARLVAEGARSAADVADAVRQSSLIVACLLRHPSVHETLDPVVDELRGKTLLNVTTTTPEESRELSAWATACGAVYLDGAILAVPSMMGSPAAQVFYSGPRTAFEQHRDVFDAWGTSVYDGADPGMAPLVDLAMLSGMYHMIAGFLHGAAMVADAGMTATQFARRATPFIEAMSASFEQYAHVVDGRAYSAPGQQSLEFSELSHLVRATVEAGVDPATIESVHILIRRQIDAGHGADGLARIYESLRPIGPPTTGRPART